MINYPVVDQLLDSVMNGVLTPDQARPLLLKENVEHPDAEIDLHVNSVVALQQYAVMTQIDRIHDEFVVTALPQMRTIHTRVRTMKWAASVAASILLLTALWFTYIYVTTDNATIYAEVYHPYQINTERSNNENGTSNGILKYFQAKNYRSVVEEYRKLNGSTNREKFLAAYAMHQSGDYQEAISTLQQILNYNKHQGSRLYNDEAEFYTGLSYLKMNDATSAARWFQIINNTPGHAYHERISNWMLWRLKWLS